MKIVKLFLILLTATLISCSGGSDESSKEAVENSPDKDKSIRQYNLELARKQRRGGNPCDTLSLSEYIIENEEEGTYLVEFDRTFTYNVPKSAVIYYKDRKAKKQYIFAVVAKSKPGERLIEPKNVIGYESSFINLDSTKLGTAFFYLTLFECQKDSTFRKYWEAEVPIHGGFNRMTLKTWKPKRIRYIELNFEAGIISGHRNYNYFFVNGIEEKPHLMETYVGLARKRTLAKVNDDKFPDYYEYRFWEDSLSIRLRDSIPFYWDTTKQLYITKYNSRWFRKY